jgi:hypothetical protein
MPTQRQPRVVSFYSKNPRKLADFKKKIEAQVKNRIENIIQPRVWQAGFGKTLRRNGDIVIGDFRDIVDTSLLLSSVKFKWIGLSLFATSDIPYFAAVLNGWQQGESYARGRNFLNLKGEKLG